MLPKVGFFVPDPHFVLTNYLFISGNKGGQCLTEWSFGRLPDIKI